jgi:hypothetical protein
MLPFQKQALHWMQEREAPLAPGTPNPLWTKAYRLPAQKNKCLAGTVLSLFVLEYALLVG